MANYIVEVEVTAIRHVTVDAASVEAAEAAGLREAIALVGGVNGEVTAVYSNPSELAYPEKELEGGL